MDHELAGRLIKARSDKGWSQADLAGESGVAAAQISRYEQGRSKPRPEVLSKLARATGVDFDWLSMGISVSDDPPPIDLFLNASLHSKLSAAANASGRSLHAEVLARLEDSLAASDEVTHLRSRLKTSDALLRNTSEGFVALYDEMPHTRDEGLRKLYVLCRARLSNDPEEIKGLGSALGEPDVELQSFLNRMAESAHLRNIKASERFRALQGTTEARAKQLAAAKKTEELAIRIATKLITSEAFLPGSFEDYPLEAWVHGTGAEATAVQEVARRVGPEADKVRSAIGSTRR